MKPWTTCLISSLALLLPLTATHAQLLPEHMDATADATKTETAVNDDQQAVILVNDLVITAGMLREFYQSRGLREPADPMAQRRQHIQVSNELINRLLMQSEAQARQLDRSPEVMQSLRLSRSEILSKALIRDTISKQEISDNDRALAYQQLIDEARQRAEYQLRHILLEDQATAENIIARLKAGENFDALYQQYSIEQFGGDEWFSLDSQEPAVAAAVKPLDAGQFTSVPVQTTFGWHVIRVDQRRAPPVPPIEKVQDGLDQVIREQKIQQLVERLRAQANIRRPGQSQATPTPP